MNRERLADRLFRPIGDDEWLTTTEPLRCEGVSPFSDRVLFAFRHQDIGPGGRFLLRRWRSTGRHSQRAAEALLVSSRHCSACAQYLDGGTPLWVVGAA